MHDARLNIAVAQMSPDPDDLQGNLATVERLHAQAVAEGAELVVFPELALHGFSVGDHHEVAYSVEGAEFERLRELSKKAALVVGFIEVSKRDRIYNSAVLLDGGEVVHVHRKVYLVNYAFWEEKKHFSQGKRLDVFPWRGFRVAVFVCYDFWYPSMQHLAASDDADLFIVCANSGVDPQARNPRIWELLIRVPSVLYGGYVVFANRCGKEADWSFWGGSAIYHPGGLSSTVASADEEIIHTLAHRKQVSRARRALPLLRDADIDFTLDELRAIRKRRAEEND